jgi:hypothetical protein
MTRDYVRAVVVCGRTTMNHMLEIVQLHKDEDEQRRILPITSSVRNQDGETETITELQSQ